MLSAGDIDGLPYYTMPFVDGESLRARLAHGELPIAETISVLRDVAKALEFAHANGVAHRDIKPDNVLMAGSSAVVTDFGVAKALSDSAGPRHSRRLASRSERRRTWRPSRLRAIRRPTCGPTSTRSA